MDITSKFQKAISSASSLDEMATTVINTLSDISEKSTEKRIGFVSGIITSEGRENIQKNIVRIMLLTDQIKEENNFVIFSSADIFTPEMESEIDRTKLPKEELLKFWGKIIKSGLITDMFMTPRWQESPESTHEYQTAKEIGLAIHYMEREY